MKHFFITLLAVIIGGLLLSIIPFVLSIAIFAAMLSAGDTQTVEPNTVLQYNIGQIVVERDADSPAQIFYDMLMDRPSSIGLSTIIDNIEKATVDTNIVGICLEGSISGASYAQTREIRSALEKFRSSGKFVYYHAQVMDRGAIYLASVADKIYLAPEGMAMLYGLTAQGEFYKGLIDKIDADVEIFRHGKFKSAVEPYMVSEMSDASRQQTQRFVDAIWATIRSDIAKSRGICEAVIDNYADKLDFATAQSAVDAGLVDSLLYYDQFIDLLANKIGVKSIDDIETISMQDYKSVHVDRGDNVFCDNVIAVIYAEGEIFDGDDTSDTQNIYGDGMAETIRDARTDDDVKAIVLRVNSPGGSALASDEIWREVKLAAESKPVVVSMGQYAASGGYYISCAANYIYAQPSTLTGSIGVFAVVPNFKRTAGKLGVTFDEVRSNTEGIPTGFTELTPVQRAFFQQTVENCYASFIARCAEGRQMTVDQIDAIGQGRVWAGTDALKIGLVDALGSLDDAITKAAQLAGIDDYEIEELPEAEDSFTLIMKELGLDAKAFIGRMFFGNMYDNLQRVECAMERPSVNARMEVDYVLQ